MQLLQGHLGHDKMRIFISTERCVIIITNIMLAASQ